MVKFLGVKKQIFVISYRNTQLSMCVVTKIVTKGALYFQFLGIPNNGLYLKIGHRYKYCCNFWATHIKYTLRGQFR